MGAPNTLSFVYGEVGVYNQFENINYEHGSSYQDLENNNLSIDYMTAQAVACGQNGINSPLHSMSIDNHSKIICWDETKDQESIVVEDNINLIRYSVRDSNNNCTKSKKENSKSDKRNKKKVQIKKEAEKKPKSTGRRGGRAGGGGGRKRGGDEQMMRRPKPKNDNK